MKNLHICGFVSVSLRRWQLANMALVPTLSSNATHGLHERLLRIQGITCSKNSWLILTQTCWISALFILSYYYSIPRTRSPKEKQQTVVRHLASVVQGDQIMVWKNIHTIARMFSKISQVMYEILNQMFQLT